MVLSCLKVLVTIDEMLFAAFTGEQNAIWIQNSEPLQGRSLHWLELCPKSLRGAMGGRGGGWFSFEGLPTVRRSFVKHLAGDQT